jgi:hypothetical protein
MPKSESTRKIRQNTDTGSTHPDLDDSHYINLENLHLDATNPRLGAKAGQFRKESDVLDTIVEVFGVDDVLSSLAVNGYFEAEPLVGVRIDKQEGQIRVAEGNRRLAACLILAGDVRAANQKKRTEQYQALQKKHHQAKITSVPVRILTNTKSLLSYLGVRHIAASQPWDSYAKAAWVAKVLDESALTLNDVTEMIGDQHQTVARSLEGYYLVNQLTKAALFNPADSERSGRGSNPEYPFSWVYTALGYGPVREWLKLPELTDSKEKTAPLKDKKTQEEASELLVFLFGNKSKNRRAAISDSRQISALARSIADPESLRMLKRGKTIEEVADLLKPAKQRIADGLLDAQEGLQSALTPLSQGEVEAADVADLIDPSKKVRFLAVEVNSKILKMVHGDEGT